jgi:flavin-binding protein dodecin
LNINGSCCSSWQDAAQAALNEAKKTIHGINGLEVVDMITKVDPNNVNIMKYHTDVKIAFGIDISRDTTAQNSHLSKHDNYKPYPKKEIHTCKQ